MKKTFLVTATIVIAVLSLVGCNKGSKNGSPNDVQQENSVNVCNSPLLSDLSALNSSIENDMGISTKATAKQVASIAIADIGGAVSGAKGGAKIGAMVGTFFGNPITGSVFGAFLGGVACGAFCSWAASPDTKAGIKQMEYSVVSETCITAINQVDKIQFNDFDKVINPKKSIIEKTIIDDSALKVGKLHNVVLASLNGEIQLDNNIVIENDETALSESILSSAEMKELFSTVTTNIANGNYLFDNSLSVAVVSLFNEVLQKCAENCEDVSTIINKYQSIVTESTELTEEEKSFVSMAFSTALYSFNYWANSSSN
ncbi:MAG: hypothetical protein MJY49_01930 [Bacteroidales bacterium]|nr:hypothetical protein [Bacteroidales bacterium]